jgi:cystathionine beta-lyase
MPTYDFAVTPDRRGDGAEKWESMYREDPDLRNNHAIVPLSVADMEFKTPPAVADALAELASRHVLGYTGPTQQYVESVVGWQQRRHGWTPKPSWLVCTPGVVPAIALAVRALTKPGDGVIIQTPVYYPFRMMVEAAGRLRDHYRRTGRKK